MIRALLAGAGVAIALPALAGPALAQGRWSPEVYASLVAMLEAPTAGRQVAVLDWDNTCIRGDVGETLLRVLDARDGGARHLSYEALCASEGPMRCYAWAAGVLAGRTEAEARALGDEVIAEGLASGALEEREELRDLIHALHQRGWEVWIVSASAQPVVQAFASRYGVPAERVIGVRLTLDDQGVLQPDLAEPLTYRRGKVYAIQHHIGLAPAFAAGDTVTDIEMLLEAPQVLLMDRGDLQLRALAAQHGWWTQPAW
ncbi:MAG: HAD-IB family phosphatase [Deltaproteobacteria bacterium]|nr:HAD-IB family phosphatase [Deltaproteobacteria bacterium]